MEHAPRVGVVLLHLGAAGRRLVAGLAIAASRLAARAARRSACSVRDARRAGRRTRRWAPAQAWAGPPRPQGRRRPHWKRRVFRPDDHAPNFGDLVWVVDDRRARRVERGTQFLRDIQDAVPFETAGGNRLQLRVGAGEMLARLPEDGCLWLILAEQVSKNPRDVILAWLGARIAQGERPGSEGTGQRRPGPACRTSCRDLTTASPTVVSGHPLVATTAPMAGPFALRVPRTAGRRVAFQVAPSNSSNKTGPKTGGAENPFIPVRLSVCRSAIRGRTGAGSVPRR